jgi:hypothetical protein
MKSPARLYTVAAGALLVLQGSATLLFRLYPPLDRAFPQLLAVTQMAPVHSLMHILSGALGLGLAWRGGARGALWFAAVFGAYYAGLALYGFATRQATVLQLQPFDHPVHLFIGGIGLAAAGLEIILRRSKVKESA